MLGGRGEMLGGGLLLLGPLVLVVGDRAVIWFVSLPSPFSASPPAARFNLLVALVRAAFVASLTAGLLLLPPT
jgi:hypothetical protein